jgi:hypothetical protein
MIRTQGHGSVSLDQMDAAVDLHVEGGDFFGTGQMPTIHDGVCLVDGDWRLVTDVKPEVLAPLPSETGAAEQLPA